MVVVIVVIGRDWRDFCRTTVVVITTAGGGAGVVFTHHDVIAGC